MSEQRWAVLGDQARNGWIVAHPGDVCRVSDGRLECWEVHSRHDTWTEAMQEADRMARTITVTLPAAHPQNPLMWLDQGLGDPATFLGRGFVLTCHPADADNLERIALVILAHARKEQHRG